MNLVLVHPEELVSETGRARIGGRRFERVRETRELHVGDTLRVGVLGGCLGRAHVARLEPSAMELEIAATEPPPQRLAVTIVLALPRPKMLGRILRSSAELGVRAIQLINGFHVEKSYWNSPRLAPEAIEEQLLLGLEQACDTILPRVELHRRFKPFVEDVLPAIAAGSTALVAHPAAARPCPRAVTDGLTLAIGPERGFTPYEVEMLERAGLASVSLGARTLRVETAVTALIGRLCT